MIGSPQTPRKERTGPRFDPNSHIVSISRHKKSARTNKYTFLAIFSNGFSKPCLAEFFETQGQAVFNKYLLKNKIKDVPLVVEPTERNAAANPVSTQDTVTNTIKKAKKAMGNAKKRNNGKISKKTPRKRGSSVKPTRKATKNKKKQARQHNHHGKAL